VLLLTGYGGALLAERAARAGIARVLTKPVQYAELAAALAPLLAGQEAEHP
jgi:CheY-like chemotaxis protein